jgi:hypothetical protein
LPELLQHLWTQANHCDADISEIREHTSVGTEYRIALTDKQYKKPCLLSTYLKYLADQHKTDQSPIHLKSKNTPNKKTKKNTGYQT